MILGNGLLDRIVDSGNATQNNANVQNDAFATINGVSIEKRDGTVLTLNERVIDFTPLPPPGEVNDNEEIIWAPSFNATN